MENILEKYSEVLKSKAFAKKFRKRLDRIQNKKIPDDAL